MLVPVLGVEEITKYGMTKASMGCKCINGLCCLFIGWNRADARMKQEEDAKYEPTDAVNSPSLQ